MPKKGSLARELISMAAEDERVREQLAAGGSLFDGYHPAMERVHRVNSARLRGILDVHGWPGRTLVGEDAMEAAWKIIMHAIGEPDLQRRGLELLREAASAGEVPRWQPAHLEDRICLFEGRPQRYGTQLDWDEDGELSPYPAIDEPALVEERRREVGLPPLAEYVERQRWLAAGSAETPPRDVAARREAMRAWARSAGWRVRDVPVEDGIGEAER